MRQAGISRGIDVEACSLGGDFDSITPLSMHLFGQF